MRQSFLEYRINNRKITQYAASVVSRGKLGQIVQDAFSFWCKSGWNETAPYRHQINDRDTLTIKLLGNKGATCRMQ